MTASTGPGDRGCCWRRKATISALGEEPACDLDDVSAPEAGSFPLAPGTVDPPGAPARPAKSIVSMPREEWLTSMPDVTDEFLAIRQAHTRTKAKILRDAMVAARMNNVLQVSTSKFKSASVALKHEQESLSLPLRRTQSLGRPANGAPRPRGGCAHCQYSHQHQVVKSRFWSSRP
ncbi:hypothetical protein BDZ90DRAFT_127033 [Jaminaea rosea]|uniref:Uncharacterized protein n=1 Tax=Jaminaea rosea TaxID=1569628 RepID=A0A316UGD9_9BASI|nr:hypothetical protein BDZ90DRAFT_127033 [Jaminaea rosea]PWN24326.1 hypothetical protein BDZ90DRAFT_127033 [Jaminaea rosea]